MSLQIDTSHFTVVYNLQFLTLTSSPGAGSLFLQYQQASGSQQRVSCRPCILLASSQAPHPPPSSLCLSSIHTRLQPQGALCGPNHDTGGKKGRLRPGQWELNSVQESSAPARLQNKRLYLQSSRSLGPYALPFNVEQGAHNWVNSTS